VRLQTMSYPNKNFIHGLKLTISAIILLEEIIKNMNKKTPVKLTQQGKTLKITEK
jgi:hypothetical protein